MKHKSNITDAIPAIIYAVSGENEYGSGMIFESIPEHITTAFDNRLHIGFTMLATGKRCITNRRVYIAEIVSKALMINIMVILPTKEKAEMHP